MKKVEMIALIRTDLSRVTGSKLAGVILEQLALKEKPYMYPPFMAQKDEYWQVEKQWWLKHKDEFTKLGFVPYDSYNKTKGIPSLMENF